MSAPIRARLLKLGASRQFEAGTVLFLKDDPCEGAVIVLSGLIKVSRFSSDGREQVLRHVQPGGSFYEVPAFDNRPLPATATAIESGVLRVIPRDQLLSLVSETPEFAMMVIDSMSERLRHMVELVEDLSVHQVGERVARVLLQSVDPHLGVGAGADFTRRITQQQIAEMTGTSREVVARALKDLRAAGAIEIRNGEVLVVRAEQLRKRAALGNDPRSAR